MTVGDEDQPLDAFGDGGDDGLWALVLLTLATVSSRSDTRASLTGLLSRRSGTSGARGGSISALAGRGDDLSDDQYLHRSVSDRSVVRPKSPLPPAQSVSPMVRPVWDPTWDW